jgi:hypothetical protein
MVLFSDGVAGVEPACSCSFFSAAEAASMMV